MKLLSFYNGLTVDLDSCVLTPPPVPPSAPTSVFTFTPNNGVPALTYTAQNPASVLQQIINFANSSSNAYTVQDGMFLISVIPTIITPLSAGTTIAITGIGFTAATLGMIHIEDSAGGLDDNGVEFTPTFVDSGHITGTWITNGDGTGPFVWLYYKDSNGFPSNVLIVDAH